MNSSSRREFLRQAGTLSACMCCVGALNFLESCGTSKSATVSVPAVPVTETADAASIPASAFSTINFQIIKTTKYHEPIYIEKKTDGSYIALLMNCTHRGCIVDNTKDR